MRRLVGGGGWLRGWLRGWLGGWLAVSAYKIKAPQGKHKAVKKAVLKM